MRLAAIFIPENTFPHLFGKDHEELTINLGGKYLYTVTEFRVTKTENPQFAPYFWRENISLVSAIVGANGTGKTSLLDIFRTTNVCEYIYEDNAYDRHYRQHETAGYQDVYYYTPHLNIHLEGNEKGNFRDLSKYQMMLDDVGHEPLELSVGLELHHSENLKRWIRAIQADELQEIITETKLPSFSGINIKINYISVEAHQTSYRFRPFFKSFEELIDEERTRREIEIVRNLKLTREDIEKRRGYYFQKLRLELEIIKRIITKVQSILEASGNKYLEEGFVNNDLTVNSEEFKSLSSTKEAFYLFLAHAYVQLTPKSKKIYFPVEEIKNLLEALLKYVPENEDIDNWTIMPVDFNAATEILIAYKAFLVAFKKDFAYDKKIALSFSPNKNLSSGEKAMYDLFGSFYDMKYRISNALHTSYGIYEKSFEIQQQQLVLIDEGDLGFHPQWKKRYIDTLLKGFQCIFPEKQIQIIFTTHDPLTLSDIPKHNITYLSKNEQGITKVEDSSLKRSFGGNISDLLTDSFFIENGLVGDFAKAKINSIITWLSIKKLEKEIKQLEEEETLIPLPLSITKREELEILKAEFENFYDVQPETQWRQIQIIDEPILRIKLQEMYAEIFEEEEDTEDTIRMEIQRLAEKLGKDVEFKDKEE
ncbi:AAA domain, putative AbiEii toxin, type IV TA system [Kordia sp. SMS9]|uniref:AAA family ATPase n=1 Tax=Kordia sp. SMS9 TaxID=2282170 RepID=UPI000E0CEA50|nr:AAA family ATPase [Kordia sp. SMS9]AXG71452.1 AAA domain, putative AbiEii toxin, type IV TA system [Kordia sp. SMS9]